MTDTSITILLQSGKKIRRNEYTKGNGYPILVIDNFNQVGRDNFTRLALSAYEIYQAKPSIAKH